MRSTRIVAAVAAFALAAPAAWAGTGTDGTHVLTLDMSASPARTSKAGKPQAVALSFKHVFVRKDGERAAAEYRRLAVSLAKGFTIDPSAAPQCKESVIAKSSKGCPSASVVGTGKAIADARPSSPNPIIAPVKVFNGIEELDVNGKKLATPRNALIVVATVGTSEVYFPAELRGSNFVVDFPKPASTALAAFIIKEISFKIRAITKGKKAFIAAPTTCPKGGWAFAETDTFWSGAKTIVAKDTQACS